MKRADDATSNSSVSELDEDDDSDDGTIAPEKIPSTYCCNEACLCKIAVSKVKELKERNSISIKS